MQRAKGSGTIRQRADGRWEASVELPPLEVRGKRRRRRMVSATRAEVEQRLAVWIAENGRVQTPGLSGWDRRQRRIAEARKLGTHTDAEWGDLCRRRGYCCEYCGVRTRYLPPVTAPNYLVKDHRVPVSRGGSDAIGNIAVACRRCNEEKGTLTAAEFMGWRSRRGA